MEIPNIDIPYPGVIHEIVYSLILDELDSYIQCRWILVGYHNRIQDIIASNMGCLTDINQPTQC